MEIIQNVDVEMNGGFKYGWDLVVLALIRF